jgi:hypothetical protein
VHYRRATECDDPGVTGDQQQPPMPPPQRYAAIGAVAAGVLGGIAGLIIGRHVHAVTAWAATLELGLPAAVIGLVVGLLVGLGVSAGRRRKSRRVG